jgi:hypothetical protein
MVVVEDIRETMLGYLRTSCQRTLIPNCGIPRTSGTRQSESSVHRLANLTLPG